MVEIVRHTFSPPREPSVMPFAPQRRDFAHAVAVAASDAEPIFFAELPPAFRRGAWFRPVRLPATLADFGAAPQDGALPPLLLRALRPVRAWIGVPDDLAGPIAGARAQGCAWLHDEYDALPACTARLSSGTRFTFWRGRRVRLPLDYASLPGWAAALRPQQRQPPGACGKQRCGAGAS